MAGCRAAAFGLLLGFALNANHFGLRNIGGFALGKNQALGPFHHEGDDDDFRGEDAKRQQKRNRLEQAGAGPLPDTRRDDFLILNAQVAQKKFIVVLEPDGPRDEFSVEPDGRVIRQRGKIDAGAGVFELGMTGGDIFFGRQRNMALRIVPQPGDVRTTRRLPW